MTHSIPTLLLDTDIGPDCDDAGAVAVLHALADLGLAHIAAAVCCTPDAAGAAALDAICAYYGRPNIPIGTNLPTASHLKPGWQKYNLYLAAHFPNRFQAQPAPDAVRVFRQALATAPDAGVDLVSIGWFTNIANLMRSPPDDISPLGGAALMEQKLRRIVSMAGCFDASRGAYNVGCPGEGIFDTERGEFNIISDLPAAQYVVQNWVGELLFCPFEAGAGILTGQGLTNAQSPVYQAYARYTEGDMRRSSWDLVTVYFAVCGERSHLPGRAQLFATSPPGQISLDAQGRSRFLPKPGGRQRYITNTAADAEIAAVLEGLLCRGDA
ncbi:MAG: nucleoside hydrolase [Oscillospiraceae bacterium]|nr:nucleoside hydrolase [Oscillospiraceae bacterium]